MVEAFVGIYGLICWLVFKKFKLVPVNTWTVVTAIFVFLAVIFMGFLWLGRYQPMTKDGQTYVIVTPIVTEVRGRVIEVAAEGGAMLEPGDVLFRIDPTPYQAKVDEVAAQLELAQLRLTQQEELQQRGGGTPFELDQARSEVSRFQAMLTQAEFDLNACTVRAPAAGYVTQVVIRPGQMVTPMAFNQVMVFVHAEGPYLAAGFQQNKVQFIDAGDEAEVAFAAAPGRVFKATVRSVQPVLSEGAVSASGRLVTPGTVPPGNLPVILEIEDDRIGDYQIPAGSSGYVTVYTGERHHLDILRKIIIRIKSWEHWVFAPGAHAGGGGGGH